MFRDSNMLTPLNDLAEKYPDFAALVSDNHPKLVAPFIEDGKQYGIVPGWNNVCMHINTNMLKDAGLEMPEKEWTLDTLLEYAQAMTKTREDGVKVYGLQVPESYFLLSGWFFNAGGSIFNEDYTECTLDSPEIIELMQFFQDCIYKYEVAPQQALAGSFINDQIGMYSAGRWPLVTYLESGFDGVALQYLPTIKTNEVVFGCALFTVYSNAVNPDAAYKLACWIGRPEGQELISAKTGIPSSTSVMEKLVRNQPVPENSYIFVDSADIARSVETPTIYADADAVLSRYVSLLYANEIDAKTAMESAAQEIDMLLQGF